MSEVQMKSVGRGAVGDNLGQVNPKLLLDQRRGPSIKDVTAYLTLRSGLTGKPFLTAS